MSQRYAAGTTVTVERSRQEIERLVQRFGATEFIYRQGANSATIGFFIKDRSIRMELEYPSLEHFRLTRDRRTRTPRQREQARDQDIRERWRALVLSIKSKFAAAEAGITTVEEEFLPYTVIPNSDTTVGEWIGQQMPALEMPQRQLGPGR